MYNAMQCCPIASLLVMLSVTASLGIATVAVQLARERDGTSYVSKFRSHAYAIHKHVKKHGVFTRQ